MTQSATANRLSAIQEAMTERGVDLAVIGPTSSLRYALGFRALATDRLTALVVSRDSAVMVMPDFESPEFIEATGFRDVVQWADRIGPAPAVEEAFKRLGDLPASPKLGRRRRAAVPVLHAPAGASRARAAAGEHARGRFASRQVARRAGAHRALRRADLGSDRLLLRPRQPRHDGARDEAAARGLPLGGRRRDRRLRARPGRCELVPAPPRRRVRRAPGRRARARRHRRQPRRLLRRHHPAGVPRRADARVPSRPTRSSARRRPQASPRRSRGRGSSRSRRPPRR